MTSALFSELQDCQTLDDVKARFALELASHGFSVSACGAFIPTNRGPEPHFFFQNWPPEWIALYQSRNFVAADYGVAEARRRIAPFTWSEAKSERDLSRAEQDLWDSVVEWGWPDGLSVPIHGPGGYFGLVTMGGRVPVLSLALRFHLHAISIAVHERCRHLAGRAIVADLPVRLTHRELECLRWIAAGKTDWEIATILGITEATTKTHVDQARSKLGARSRAQAVARMVLAGLS